jgi:hypothetical protein
MKGSLSQISTEPTATRAEKVELPLQLEKAFPQHRWNYQPFVSVETTRVCLPIGNNEDWLVGRAWSDADITELFSFRPKSILAGDLNANNPFWNSAVSNPSGEKLLRLFYVNQFEISAPQCPTHYSPAVNGDVLHVLIHQNIGVSDVIISDILDSGHIPITLNIRDLVKIGNLSDLIERFTGWYRIQSLASDLIPPRIENNSG